MPKITLPDGSVRQFDTSVSGKDVAASIGAGLAKAAVAVRVDGELWDLTRPDRERCETRNPDAGLRRRARAAAPRCRARARRGRQGTLAGYPGNHRAGHRERFLLRFCPRRTVYGRRSRNHRGAHEGNRRPRRDHQPRSLGSRRGGRVLPSIGEAYKAEIIESIPADEDLTLVPPG